MAITLRRILASTISFPIFIGPALSSSSTSTANEQLRKDNANDEDKSAKAATEETSSSSSACSTFAGLVCGEGEGVELCAIKSSNGNGNNSSSVVTMSTPNAVGGGVKKEDKNGGGDTGNNDDNIKTEEMQPLCRAMASTPTPLTTGPGSKMASHSGLLADGCCQGGMAVILNVGGQRHEVLRKNFDRYPGSRLWKVMRADSVDEILTYCDRYRVAASNDDVPEYFFDRNYTGFASLLDAYRTGHLHVCSINCAVITRDDLAYWGIDDLLMEPCCAVKYYPEIEICTNELVMEEDEKRKEEERQKLEDFGQSTLGRTRKYLWDLFEYPQTSRGAQVRKEERMKEALLNLPKRSHTCVLSLAILQLGAVSFSILFTLF